MPQHEFDSICITSKSASSKPMRDRASDPFVFIRSCNYFRSDSLRIVPIFLSLRVSLPSEFRIVPGGRPCFFSKVPTVQSLLVLRAMFSLLILHYLFHFNTKYNNLRWLFFFFMEMNQGFFNLRSIRMLKQSLNCDLR